jgi:hypothetical protein
MGEGEFERPAKLQAECIPTEEEFQAEKQPIAGGRHAAHAQEPESGDLMRIAASGTQNLQPLQRVTAREQT